MRLSERERMLKIVERSGRLLTVLGVLLLLAALGLTIYNIYDTERAERAADESAKEVAAYREEVQEEAESQMEDVIVEDNRPDYEKNPNMPMPEVEIDGRLYIGNLQVPSLGLDLPVISQWSYPALKKAPCRYSGSVYLNNMVIAAHNYRRHFGPVRDLPKGASVIFIDMKGNTFYYEVMAKETLDPMESEKMKNSGYDMALFTCVLSGQARSAIYCNKVAAPETAAESTPEA